MSPNWNAFTNRPVASSLAASHSPLCYFSLRLLYHPYESLRLILLCHLMNRLCLPTSFPISGLARLGVKQRLCRSYWRAFASPHSLILPSTSPREAFLACPPSHSWDLPFFTVESTLSSPCSCYGPPLSCQGSALAHLDSLLLYNLVL